MKKRLLAVTLAAACMVSSLAGCAGTSSGASSAAASGAASNAGSQAPAKLSGTITVASWNNAADVLSAIAKKYMAENPGTTVTVNYVDSDYTKLYPALAAGTGVPDVFQTQARDFPAFMNKYPGSFADVTDVIGTEKDNFAASAISQCAGSDGKYYAVPWDIGPCALMYRKDVFEQAGVDAASLKTWDQFYDAAVKIKAKTGKAMLGFNYNGATSTDNIMLLMQQQGGSFYDANGKVKLGSDEMIKAADFLVKMKKAGLTMDLPKEWDDRIAALNADKLATLPYAAWYTGTMINSVAKDKGKWGFVPLPAFEGKGNAVGLGGSILAISSTSQNTALAKSFVKYAMMTVTGAKVNLDYGQFTSYKPAYKDESMKTKDAYFGVSLSEVFSPLMDAPAINFGPYFTDVQAALKTAVGEIFVNGKDPKTALDAASVVAQKAIDAQ